MIAALTTLVLALSSPATDPRIALLELQIEGHPEEALERVDAEIREHPEEARRLGLDYLRADLLQRLGRHQETSEAFMRAMTATPRLALYSRYRVALEEEDMGHPEVAAGLVASVVAGNASPDLEERAVALLAHTVTEGGDCRLLGGLDPQRFADAERRQLLLIKAQCALRSSDPKQATHLFVELLREDTTDDTAREAAERLTALPPASGDEEQERTALVGLTLHQHREFGRAIAYLDRALQASGDMSDDRRFDIAYARARSLFWQGHFDAAAARFGELAQAVDDKEKAAPVLYQQARCFELEGQWRQAFESYRTSFRADPDGDYADAALLAALRLKWRMRQEEEGKKLYAVLASRRAWHTTAARAALFLAASDLVQGRADRAGAWLDDASQADPNTGLEVAYWRGRLAELEHDPRAAIASYLAVLRADLYHPLAQGAAQRLAKEPLASAARAEGLRLATSSSSKGLYGAWLLLGDASPSGRAALDRLRRRLARDRGAGPFLRMEEVPVRSWPLWEDISRQPEEMLLALGIWDQAESAVLRNFPPSNPDLAFTGSLLLARAGSTRASIHLAEILARRIPDRLPEPLLPIRYRRLLYPLAHRDEVMHQANRQGIDPFLLAAVIREESRFDPDALSDASARGLTQFVQPTAHRVAAKIGLGSIEPDDIYHPHVAIALGAAYIRQLAQLFRGTAEMVVAAYNAGEPQASLWRNYCFRREMEEYYTKVGFRETRAYLRKVLGSWARYRALYAVEPLPEVPPELAHPAADGQLKGPDARPARRTAPPPVEDPPGNHR